MPVAASGRIAEVLGFRKIEFRVGLIGLEGLRVRVELRAQAERLAAAGRKQVAPTVYVKALGPGGFAGTVR